MSAHQEVHSALVGKHRLTVDGSTAGVSKVTAANNTLTAAQLDDIIHIAKAEGCEVTLQAGVLYVRPKDSAL